MYLEYRTFRRKTILRTERRMAMQLRLRVEDLRRMKRVQRKGLGVRPVFWRCSLSMLIGMFPRFSSFSKWVYSWPRHCPSVADFAVWCFSLIDAPMELVIGTSEFESFLLCILRKFTSALLRTVFLYSLLGYASLIGLSIAVLFLPLNHWTSKGFATTQDKLVSSISRSSLRRCSLLTNLTCADEHS